MAGVGVELSVVDSSHPAIARLSKQIIVPTIRLDAPGVMCFRNPLSSFISDCGANSQVIQIEMTRGTFSF